MFYLVNKKGEYLGAFDEGSVPKKRIEVPSPPEDGNQVWDFKVEAWGELPYFVRRSRAYAEKEEAGDIPSSMQENIDELWKALETAELHGAELPPKASSIIRHRRAVKTAHPKKES